MLNAIIYDKWLAGLGGGEVVACQMARTLKDNGYEVLFLSKDVVSPGKIKDKLGIDLSDVTFKQVLCESDLQPVTNDYLLTTNHQPLVPDLFINLSFMDYSYGFAKKNVYYVHFPSVVRSGIFNFVLIFFQFIKKLVPSTINQRPTTNYFIEKINDRLRAGIYPDMKKRLRSYQIYIANSDYVKKWVKKFWNSDVKVLYPPVSLITNRQTKGESPSGRKNDWIASVGRFFTLGHGKKQEIMIEAFKKCYHQLPSTNYQLHLIGGVGDEPSSLRYVEELKEMAKGFPIFFHFNAPRVEVEEILLKSKIYWHAAGYGEDPERDPITFEHFGIAPVEAISAGCIPILFNGGGLPEILEKLNLDPKTHLFNTIDELSEKTFACINGNTNTAESMPNTEYFSKNNFAKSFLSIIK